MPEWPNGQDSELHKQLRTAQAEEMLNLRPSEKQEEILWLSACEGSNPSPRISIFLVFLHFKISWHL